MATTRETMEAQAALTLDVDGDGVAWLVFDRPDARVNVLSSEVMLRLDRLLGEVEEGARTGRVKALVVRSAKPGSFIAGADVEEIAGVTDPGDAEAGSRAGQEVFRRLERLPIPSVAAIDGTCLGGGVELALACAYRIASDRPETRIGFPEVRLGIIPGWGGTTRLPRLVGLRAAVEMIVTGKPISARRARRIGLVDEVVPPAILVERTRRFAWERIDRGPKRARARKRLGARLLEETAPGRRLLLWQARKQVLRETKGQYPAPLAALDVLARTLSLPLDAAFALEARTVGHLAVSDVCKSLIHVFFLMERAKKAAPAAEPRQVERVGVLGAGVMGGGIAQLLAYRGIPVRLKDIRSEAIALGLRHAREIFDRAVRRGRLQRRDADHGMDRIAPTLDYAGFGATDVVIEAVVERMDVKQQVLREVESRVRADAILASNTSALSITEMANGLDRPENVCGMHFFNPVHRMPLVEIVRGAATSDGTLATAFALARRLDKTPVLVNDGPGFLVNRLLAPYLNEAGWLLAEGARIEDVDRAMLEFGMPMGPFRLLDEVGLDVSRHVAAILYEAFGDRLLPAPALVKLAETARLGRKGGRGFYRYENDREQGPDETLYAELAGTVSAERRAIAGDVVRERCVLVMVNEAARALEDGIVDDPGAVDLAMITGTGFPPFRGGLLRYADAIGLDRIVETLEAYERSMGVRFQPSALLKERAAAGRGFYGRP
ncbi:MAG TPA: 3-hydroxyacyl-CoA dehydrogenase NAD-binding domain-containing protein [Longimicrobiales bacterium]